MSNGPDPGFIAWAYVKHQFTQGDDRPLWQYVRDHPLLQPEQREFVADVGLGLVKTDRRKPKASTEQAVDFYESAIERGYEHSQIMEAVRQTQGDAAEAARKAIERHLKAKNADTRNK